MFSNIDTCIIRSIQKTATQEEYEILNRWLRESNDNVSYYTQLEEIWYSRDRLSDEDIQTGWQTLANEISSHNQLSEISKSKKQIFLSIYHIAAMVIGIIIASSIWFVSFKISKESREQVLVQNIFFNKTGVHSIVLPDNSEVWLNENSRLTYPNTFEKEIRLVTLVGKAYFDVHKDLETPFIVQIKNMEIEVTGTEFFVESYLDDQSFITLISGSINLNYKNKQGEKLSTSMTPGQKVYFNHSDCSLEIENVDTNYLIAWKDGTYSFKEESLDNIIFILAKHFNLNIHITSSLKSIRFTGKILPDESIEEVLNSLTKSYPIVYNKVGDEIYIEKNNMSY